MARNRLADIDEGKALKVDWVNLTRALERAIPLLTVALMMVVAKQQTTIDDLRWKIAATAANHKEASLEVQALCTKQAKIAYDAQGFKARDMAAYQSHYNERINKCMIHIENRTFAGNGSSDIRTVLDAFENRDYANYMWSSDGTRKFNEVPPMVCEIKLMTGDKQKCQSQAEFEALIRKYMEG